MRGALDGEIARELYPELLKRLDDSNDQVRRTVCATIADFFGAVGGSDNFSSTLLGYMVDTLLIHLDDPEDDMQQAVLATLEAAIPRDANLIAKKARKAVSSHRDGQFAEALAAKAETHAKG